MATPVDEPMERRPVARGVVAWEDGGVKGDGEEDKEVEAEFAELSPEMVSLDFALRTPCFEGFEGERVSYLYTAQLTCANVMSTVVTARPIDTSAKRKNKLSQTLDGGKAQNHTRSNQHESPSRGSTTTTNAAIHVYAQACNPKKVKKHGKYQAQLPAFRRSLPALPIPVNRLNHELVQERDKFMRQLHKEREEKQRLDNWAATKIQACYRGFCARPRVVTYETRLRLNTVSSIRLDLTGMEATLKRAVEPAPTAVTEGGGSDGKPRPSSASPWRKEIESRAGKKRDFRVRKELMQCAATKIQAAAKRFLARFAYAKRLARHYDEVYAAAIVRIQSVFRAFRLRARIMAVVAKLQSQAAIQIQSLIRGIQTRERVLTFTFERKCEHLRRAGLPLQFTLPSRTQDLAHTSCLRVLVEHRKTAHQVAFKSAAWRDERMLLQIYKVSTKLNVQRQWLLRLTIPPPTARQRKKRGAGLARQPSRLQSRPSAGNLGIQSGPSSPTHPVNGRRRVGHTTATTSPTSSRPANPATWQPRGMTPPGST